MLCLTCLKIISKSNYSANLPLKTKYLEIFYSSRYFKEVLSLSSSLDKVVLRHSSSSAPRYQENKEDPSHLLKKGGFAKAYDKFSTPEAAVPEKVEQSFHSLLKSSKFIDLGDPEGKIVTGTIIHVVENDLYVDFGWKFHCVVSRPLKNEHEYVRGAKVRLILKDLELSSRFLGSEKDLTLLEADAILIGLVSSPAKFASSLQIEK